MTISENPQAGKIIAIEGIDGSGKSTLAKFLTERYLKEGIPASTYAQPKGTPIGEFMRQQFKKGELSNEAAIFLMYAARIELMQKHVIPDLQQGKVVILDRHTISSAVEQGLLHDRYNEVKKVHAIYSDLLDKISEVRVDLWINLYITPELALKRIRARGQTPGDATEPGDDTLLLQNLAKQRRAYDSLSEAPNLITVYCREKQDQEKLFNDVFDEAKKFTHRVVRT